MDWRFVSTISNVSYKLFIRTIYLFYSTFTQPDA